jgi:hypothetical protein
LALLAGSAGFLIASRTLPGLLGTSVGAALLVPSVTYCVRHARRLFAESKARIAARDAALLEQARGTENPALALMTEASIEDAHERQIQALWRKLRMGLALPVAMATLGFINGDLRTAAFGALIGAIPPVGALIVSRFGAPISDERKRLKV